MADKRDFREETLQKITGQLDKVSVPAFSGSAADTFGGDRSVVLKWAAKLGFVQAIAGVDAYHSNIAQLKSSTVQTIRTIFGKARNIDDHTQSVISGYRQELQDTEKAVDRVKDGIRFGR